MGLYPSSQWQVIPLSMVVASPGQPLAILSPMPDTSALDVCVYVCVCVCVYACVCV